MQGEYTLSSESVAEGHPDKIADQISDAVLDCALSTDPDSRVACETMVTQSAIIIAGEISSSAVVPYEHVAKGVIRKIGCTDAEFGLDHRSCSVFSIVHEQAVDIDRGVTLSDGEIGAGDQGSMFGYATDETPEFMPLGISLAHKLMQKHAELRKNGMLEWLRPDGKTQVTVRYDGDRPVGVTHIVFSTQHAFDTKASVIRDAVIEEIIDKVVPAELRAPGIKYLINPTGRFVVGGPQADTGLTGRKIIVDSYGGSCPHGGGAFSGKDPSKVDRSAAYMARYIAKNIVAAELSRRCTVQLAYAIGTVDPVDLTIDLHGTGTMEGVKLTGLVCWLFKLTPRGIIEMLKLRRPIYESTAVYGHFGRELAEFTWEKTDMVDVLREYRESRGGAAR
jgi:S-adenosylmethionine synthetase